MTTLYTTYYNQYMQQYQAQQQKAQEIAAKEDAKSTEALEALQKQAAYYAQQQRTIQTQLEASLSETAEQLIQEIANLAAAKTTQPLVMSQFQQQQQHHLHQQHYTAMQQQQQQQQGPHPNAMMMRHIVNTPQQQLVPSSVSGGVPIPPVPIMPMMAPPQAMNVVQPNIFY